MWSSELYDAQSEQSRESGQPQVNICVACKSSRVKRDRKFSVTFNIGMAWIKRAVIIPKTHSKNWYENQFAVRSTAARMPGLFVFHTAWQKSCWFYQCSTRNSCCDSKSVYRLAKSSLFRLAWLCCKWLTAAMACRISLGSNLIGCANLHSIYTVALACMRRRHVAAAIAKFKNSAVSRKKCTVWWMRRLCQGIAEFVWIAHVKPYHRTAIMWPSWPVHGYCDITVPHVPAFELWHRDTVSMWLWAV